MRHGFLVVREFFFNHSFYCHMVSFIWQDQRTEQLRGTAFLAALVAGFVMMSFVQFEFDPESISPAMLLGFGITNSLTVRPLAQALFAYN